MTRIFLPGTACALLMLAAMPERAWGHGPAQWIQDGGFRSPDGLIGCCGENDCSPLADGDVDWTPAGWLIKSLNETVPEREALPSNDSHFWRCRKYDGSRRCFFRPGPGS